LGGLAGGCLGDKGREYQIGRGDLRQRRGLPAISTP